MRISALVRRARLEDGFGLVELLIALTLLAVAAMAIVAGFTSGTSALVRAGRASTGAALADKQIELYRGLPWSKIRLASATIPTTAPYTDEYSGAQVTESSPLSTACPSPLPATSECHATRTVSGADSPDGRAYRIDTYIVFEEPTGTGRARLVKKVTVVVRDVADANRVLAREISTFDRLGS